MNTGMQVGDHSSGSVCADALPGRAGAAANGTGQQVGYRTLDEEARSLLFAVINARYLKGSIITTAHVGIASWADRLADPMSFTVMTHAMMTTHRNHS